MQLENTNEQADRKGVSKRNRTLDGLREVLSPDFALVRRADLPLLIREHARKFEYIVSEATVWQRAS